jgi:hypothetical protein
VCFVCREEIPTELTVFLQHLKTAYNLNDRNARYICVQQECRRTSGSKFSFVHHIKLNYSSALSPNFSMPGNVL